MPRGGKILDLTGHKYGRLTPLKMVERNSSNKVQWLCLCDCGNTVKVTTGHLRSGHTKSCGCYNIDSSVESSTTHNGKGTRLYEIWEGMKKRCNNPNSKYYHLYGGRGICVCDEWQNDFSAFRDWAMANGYEDNLTIDRMEVDGNYEPSNCRWATRKEQNNNTRRNHIITVGGVSKNIAQWSEYLGIKRYAIDSAYKRGKDLPEFVERLISEKAGET